MPSDQQHDAAETSDDDIQSYDTDHGVVVYDVLNPLAWVESRLVISLEEYR